MDLTSIINPLKIQKTKLKVEEQFKDLFIFDGAEFIKLKENTSLKYLKTLSSSILQSERAIALLNKMNLHLLESAEGIASQDNIISLEDITSIQIQIKAILENQKNLMQMAKDAPNWIATLKDLEDRLLKDLKEEMELLGGGVKAFREDVNNIYDRHEPSEITQSRFNLD